MGKGARNLESIIGWVAVVKRLRRNSSVELRNQCSIAILHPVILEAVCLAGLRLIDLTKDHRSSVIISLIFGFWFSQRFGLYTHFIRRHIVLFVYPEKLSYSPSDLSIGVHSNMDYLVLFPFKNLHHRELRLVCLSIRFGFESRG